MTIIIVQFNYLFTRRTQEPMANYRVNTNTKTEKRQHRTKEENPAKKKWIGGSFLNSNTTYQKYLYIYKLHLQQIHILLKGSG
jgi:hypothetical protein